MLSTLQIASYEFSLGMALQADRLAPDYSPIQFSQIKLGDTVKISEIDPVRIVVSEPRISESGNVEFQVMTEAGLTYSWSASANQSVLLVDRTSQAVAA